MDEWSHAIKFPALCDFLESLTKHGVTKEQKVAKMRRFLTRCRDNLPQTGNASLFPIMRLLLPQLDQERGSYGIKETVFAKLFIDLLKMAPNSKDSLRLKNYKAPANARGAKNDVNDFASVLFEVIKDRANDRRGVQVMTIEDVNKQLTNMVVLNAQRQGVNEILMDMFKHMDSVMIKWVVRIILKDLKLGLGTAAIFNCFHQDAREFFDTNANLRKVCEALKDPQKRMHEVQISLFTAFKPMLAESVAIDKIEGDQILDQK